MGRQGLESDFCNVVHKLGVRIVKISSMKAVIGQIPLVKNPFYIGKQIYTTQVIKNLWNMWRRIAAILVGAKAEDQAGLSWLSEDASNLIFLGVWS